MNVKLNNLGKRFNRQWIFRASSIELLKGNRYVILGSNGSGKSTLLQTIAGYRVPSEGEVRYQNPKQRNYRQSIPGTYPLPHLILN
jgi:ABC-type sugar transport system ATPase subunit